MGKILIFLIIILGIIVVFFKGATKLILALTGFKKVNNSQAQNKNKETNKSPDNSDVIYEKGETKVFKGKAGIKRKEQ